MEIVELKAEPRAETGKKGAKACRNAGLLPGVLYGSGEEPRPLSVHPKELDRALHTHAGINAIIKLTLGDGGNSSNVVVKDLQVDFIKGTMSHVDFCSVSLDKKIKTNVPFKVFGEAAGVKMGGILEHILWEIEVECLPMDIPDSFELDVTELEIGDKITIGSVTLPENVTIATDPKRTIVLVAAPRVEEVEEPEEVEGVEGEEPEVISDEAKEGEEAKTAEDSEKKSDKKSEKK
jgi:large subunit ribosomal protein L25